MNAIAMCNHDHEQAEESAKGSPKANHRLVLEHCLALPPIIDGNNIPRRRLEYPIQYLPLALEAKDRQLVIQDTTGPIDPRPYEG